MLSPRTINLIRNATEKSAEKWYIELKQSRYKYIAHFKERIDSLLSYQKKLHEIIASSKKDEVKIRAISELHSIEISIFSLWKQLPDLDIVTVDKAKANQQQQEQEQEERVPCIVDIEDINGVEELPAEVQGLWHNWIQCDGCKRWWSRRDLLDYHKRKSDIIHSSCAIPNVE